MAATTLDTLLIRIEADLATMRGSMSRAEAMIAQSSTRMAGSVGKIGGAFGNVFSLRRFAAYAGLFSLIDIAVDATIRKIGKLIETAVGGFGRFSRAIQSSDSVFDQLNATLDALDASVIEALRRALTPLIGEEAAGRIDSPAARRSRALDPAALGPAIEIPQRFGAEPFTPPVAVETEEAQRARDLARLNDMAEEAGRIFEKTRTPVERYDAELARLNELVQAGAIQWDTYQRAADLANEELQSHLPVLEEVETALQRFGREASDSFGLAQSAAVSALDRMEDSLVSFSLGTKSAGASFRSFASGIIEDLLRMQIRQNITGQLSGFFNSLIGNIFGGRATTAGSGGGGRKPKVEAAGGPVSAWSPYIVGEAGPELFVPRVAGTIIPNHALGGGASVVVNQAFDFRGADASTIVRLEAVADRIKRQAVAEATGRVAALTDRGGGFAKSTGRRR